MKKLIGKVLEIDEAGTALIDFEEVKATLISKAVYPIGREAPNKTLKVGERVLGFVEDGFVMCGASMEYVNSLDSKFSFVESDISWQAELRAAGIREVDKGNPWWYPKVERRDNLIYFVCEPCFLVWGGSRREFFCDKEGISLSIQRYSTFTTKEFCKTWIEFDSMSTRRDEIRQQIIEAAIEFAERDCDEEKIDHMKKLASEYKFLSTKILDLEETLKKSSKIKKSTPVSIAAYRKGLQEES